MTHLKRNLGLFLALVAAALLLGGCATPKRGDPEFAATMPPVQQPPQQINGAIFQAGTELAFFEDIKARRVGDILTVVLMEKIEAEKEADTEIDRASSTSITNPTVFGDTGPPFGLPFDPTLGLIDSLAASLESTHAFDGETESTQEHELEGTISVTVASVLPNGNLVVQGEKWIGINQGEEYIRLRGIVRPVDIRPDNTLLSTQIANAQIAYGGKGALDDANRMGWLARFFIGALFPF